MLRGLLVSLAIGIAVPASAIAEPLARHQGPALDIYKELVEIDTVVGVG